ncbi:HAD-IA family hydrolase [Streptococcus himalayensis]|nr:HAD-IA family hydrolase [Streptococcus himalayensis]
MNYQDYIWDLGGTLLDNYESSTAAFVKTLAKYGRDANHDDVYQALKCSTADAIQEFASDIPEFLTQYKKEEALALARPLLFPGTQSLLAAIVDAGGRNFLVSHRNNQVLELLEKTGISVYFTEVVTSESGFQRKPNPESMLYLKEKYAISNGLVIGDREIDRQAGAAAGLATYLFDSMENLRQTIQC